MLTNAAVNALGYRNYEVEHVCMARNHLQQDLMEGSKQVFAKRLLLGVFFPRPGCHDVSEAHKLAGIDRCKKLEPFDKADFLWARLKFYYRYLLVGFRPCKEKMTTLLTAHEDASGLRVERSCTSSIGRDDPDAPRLYYCLATRCGSEDRFPEGVPSRAYIVALHESGDRIATLEFAETTKRLVSIIYADETPRPPPPAGQPAGRSRASPTVASVDRSSQSSRTPPAPRPSGIPTFFQQKSPLAPNPAGTSDNGRSQHSKLAAAKSKGGKGAESKRLWRL